MFLRFFPSTLQTAERFVSRLRDLLSGRPATGHEAKIDVCR